MDSLADFKFSCKCSWKYKEDIRHAVSFGNLSETTNGTELGNLVQLETCVLLTKPESDEPCTLNISFEDSSLQIVKLSAVSEARIIEIYGLYNEYIKTVKAENLDDVEGMLVNLAEAEVTPLKEITLKFAGIKNARNMWLFGVRLVVVRFETPAAHDFSKVNYQNVEERLRAAKVPITEKAERCKKFLQQYTNITNNCAGKQPDPQTVLKLLEEDCIAQLKPLSVAGKNVSKCISNFIPALLTRRDGKCTTGDNGYLNPEVVELKQYIDSSIQKLENRLIDHFNEKLKELEIRQNEKLDSILMMLKER